MLLRETFRSSDKYIIWKHVGDNRFKAVGRSDDAWCKIDTLIRDQRFMGYALNPVFTNWTVIDTRLMKILYGVKNEDYQIQE